VNKIQGFQNEYRFLSNFYAFPEIEIHGYWVRSVEHIYQASKTDNLAQKARILNAASAALAKKLGRECDVRVSWDAEKYDIMEGAVRAKFTQHYHLKLKLLATGDAYLEETNPWGDTYWGVCQGVGLNQLGSILMQVREELRCGVAD